VKPRLRSLYRFGTLALLTLLALQVGREPAPAESAGLASARAATTAKPGRSLWIPVAGVDADDLRDTWGQPRSGSRRHAAIDIMAPKGTPVLAAADSVVVKLYVSKAGGNTVYLKKLGDETLHYYAHLDGYADGLREGMQVAGGSVIGFVGTTGNAPATAPHLHFAIERLPKGGKWWEGEAVNPYPILREEATAR
jgi:murein DD-endopeptidase MepM/ murein hydrolase activator NlpD